MDQEISKLVLLALVTEGTSEYLFSGIPRLDRVIKYLSVVVGISVALLFKADLFATMGIDSVNAIASQVLTGIIISRGSNIVNDLLQSVYKLRERI